MERKLAVLSLLTTVAIASVVGGCGNGSNTIEIPDTTPEIKEFRRAAFELQQREPDTAERVTIQYIQIPKGISGYTESKPELSLEQAEQLAAQLYARALDGEDFDRLVLHHSYESLTPGQRPGVATYVKGPLPKGEGPITFSRESMADVDLWQGAWRLEAGEVGAVEWHHERCESGFYVLRRFTEEDIRADNPASGPAASELVEQLRNDARSLMSRDEHGAERVKVQHLVIARFMTAPSGRQKILQPAEAEKLAAEVYAKVRAGEDFTKIVEEFTYDALQGDPTGAYVLVKDDSELAGTKRGGMIPAFGDAAWRLEVGEVGVVLYDPRRSFYGYHIIKRLE